MFHVEHITFGVYAHVPFCLSKCGYCDFCRITDLSLADAYLKTIDGEMAASIMNGESPRTVYVGGGTPSCLGTDRLARLLSSINRHFNMSEVREFTVECNPEDVTPELADVLTRAGVNRVSMGAQSLHDQALRMMGRRHNAERVPQAIATLRRAGIDNISVDCIFGLPEVDGYDVAEDFRRFASLGVEHLSAYALQYEQGSRFTRMADDGTLTPLPDDEVADEYTLLTQTLRDAGYEHYEISNYARPGREALHNSSYWDRTAYYGFGPAASSFAYGQRWTNTYSVEEYIKSESSKRYFSEGLSQKEIAEEVIMLGMRTRWGVWAENVPDECRDAFLKNVRIEMQLGNVIRQQNGSLRIPEERWMVSDMIIRNLTDF